MICRINSNSKFIESLIDLDIGGTVLQKQAIAEHFNALYSIPFEERKCN